MMTETAEDIKEDEMAFAEKIKEEIRRIDDVEKSLRRLAGNEIVCNAEYNRRNVSDCLELADSLRLLLVSYDESFALTEEKTVGCSREIKRDVGLVSYIEFPIFFTAGDGEKRLFKVGRSERIGKNGKKGLYKKSISVDDAFRVMELIYSFEGEKFKQADIPLPRHKVDLAVGALVDSGAVGISERGRYRVLEGSPKSWMDNLDRMEKRTDLLLVAKK